MITTQISPQEAINTNLMYENIFFRLGISKEEKCSLKNITKQNNLDTDFIVNVLNYFDGFQDIQISSFNHYSIPVLVDYLVKSHKYYVNKKLLEIEQTINTILYADYESFKSFSPSYLCKMSHLFYRC